ncbi:MAG: type II secretion system F family protein [Pseudomonadota bacterium]|nr:type II secretion system F family protein [Pseudomonadota bacterium]
MKLILVVVLTTAIAAIGITLSLILSQRLAARDRALSIISGNKLQDATGKPSDKNDPNKRRAALARKLKESEQEEKDDKKKKEKGKSTMRELIQQAGFDFPVSYYYILSIVSAAAFTIGAFSLGFPRIVIAMISIIGFFGFPRLVLFLLTKRRQKKFLEDFADALEAMMRLLKAGMPMNEAVKMCAKEFEGPIGEEMSRIYELQKIGTPLGEAAVLVAKRMPIPEMRMFATGLLIQQQTGSSLSDILGNLAKVIRSRFQLKRKVKALSAEAKSSAGIIAAMPPLVALGLNTFNPGYIDIIFETRSGHIGLACFGLWMFTGMVIMWKMSNFKV